MINLGFQDFIFVIIVGNIVGAIVGAIVGLCFGLRSKYDQMEIPAMLVKLAFCCGFTGITAPLLLIKFFLAKSNRYNDTDYELFLIVSIIIGVFFLMFATPFALAIWHSISRSRIRRRKNDMASLEDTTRT